MNIVLAVARQNVRSHTITLEILVQIFYLEHNCSKIFTIVTYQRFRPYILIKKKLKKSTANVSNIFHYSICRFLFLEIRWDISLMISWVHPASSVASCNVNSPSVFCSVWICDTSTCCDWVNLELRISQI